MPKVWISGSEVDIRPISDQPGHMVIKMSHLEEGEDYLYLKPSEAWTLANAIIMAALEVEDKVLVDFEGNQVIR